MTIDQRDRDMTGFRLAKGNKFETILDSYVYMLSLVGVRTDEHTEQETERWMCILVSEDFVADLGVLANQRGLRIDHLELTAEEVIELNTTASIVVIETPEGLVEVNYFFQFDEAYKFFDDLYTDGITIDKATSARLKKKPRKKRLTEAQMKDIMKRVDEELTRIGRGKKKQTPRQKKDQKLPAVSLLTPATKEALRTYRIQTQLAEEEEDRRRGVAKTAIPRGTDLNESLFESVNEKLFDDTFPRSNYD